MRTRSTTSYFFSEVAQAVCYGLLAIWFCIVVIWIGALAKVGLEAKHTSECSEKYGQTGHVQIEKYQECWKKAQEGISDE